MRLIIDNPDNLDLKDFCLYIIEKLTYEINYIQINNQVKDLWNNYLKLVFSDENLTLQKVLKLFFNNQTYYKQKNNYIITVNNKIKIDDIPIDRIAQTIISGTLDIKGYDIFSEVYARIASQIDSLYEQWEKQR